MSRHLSRILLSTALLAAACHAFAADDATPFIRVAEEAGRPTALQVAIVTYAPEDGADGVTVDLIGAIHVGDSAYYRELNGAFRDYDALLYEMVIPDDGDDGSREYQYDMSFVSGTQVGLKNALGLAHQLDEIDYRPDNFVHADMTTGKLAESMADRNESLYVYFWRVFFASLDEYAKDPLGLRDLQLLGNLLLDNRQDAFKIALAYELADATSAGDILGGAEGSAVIAARNEHAVSVLGEELARGAKRVGIFYGVAHMPDLEERLAGLSLRKVDTVWVDAWDLRPSRSDASGSSARE